MSKKNRILDPGLSFLTVFAVLLILLKIKGYAPFGLAISLAAPGVFVILIKRKHREEQTS